MCLVDETELILEDEELLEALDFVFNKRKFRRLSCFAHALHNVIKDAFKKASKIPALMKPLEKVRKLALKAHNCQSFADEMEKTCGKTIPKSNDTRWNSQLKMLRSVLEINAASLDLVLKETGNKDLSLKRSELSILRTFVEAS